MTPDEIKHRIEDDIKAHQERCDSKRALEAETVRSRIHWLEDKVLEHDIIIFGPRGDSDKGMQVRFDRVEQAVTSMVRTQRALQKLIWAALLGLIANVALLWMQKGGLP